MYGIHDALARGFVMCMPEIHPETHDSYTSAMRVRLICVRNVHT